jgi:metal-responsive CopG/Arc/MetJ family transcriptional regulator
MYSEVMDSIQITARVPAGLVARLDKFAAEHHWSRSTAIQLLLDQGLDEEDAAQADSGKDGS